MDIYKNEMVSKYDVPLRHLEFDYINECKDVKELEKILRILRSGKEGRYPELEQCAEERLTELHPHSKALRKELPVRSMREIEKGEAEQIAADLNSWGNEMKEAEETLKTKRQKDIVNDLPPVRGSATVITSHQNSSGTVPKAAGKKPVTPRSYSDWDKIDVDAELAKIDGEEETKKKKKKTNVLRKPRKPEVEEEVSATDLTPQERSRLCEREKDKGNEAFRAGDYEEAEVYYNRSLSLQPTTAVTNNRAQTYLKLMKWDKAIADCQTVLAEDNKNIKGYLRRALAYQGKKQYKSARADLEVLLQIDPGNKRAKKLLQEVDDSLAEEKVKGHRMVIEEVDESDDETEVTDTNRLQAAATTPSPTASLGKGEEGGGMTKGTGKVGEKILTEKPALGSSPQTSGDKSEESRVDTTSAAPSGGDGNEKGLREEGGAPLPREVARLKEEGNELFRSGQYPEARDKYTEGLELLTDDVTRHVYDVSVLYTNRAVCRHKSGDCQGCVEDCTAALQLTPQSPKPLLRRAVAYEALERYKHAYVDFRQALTLEASWDVAQQGATRCGRMLQEMYGKSWRDHLPAAAAQQQQQQQPQQQQQQHEHQPQQQQPKPQQQQLHKKKKHHKQKEQQQQNKQQQQHSKQQQQQQNQQQQQQSKQQPQQPPAPSQEEMFEKHKAEGNAHVVKGEFAAAVGCYTACVSVCGDRVVAFTNRALCYLRTNQPDKAETDCSTALTIEPHNVKALFRRAQARKMLHKYSESLSDLDALLTLDPQNKPAVQERTLVVNYRDQQEAVRQPPRRQKVTIEEVDSSSDEEDDKDESYKKSVSSREDRHSGGVVSSDAETVAKTASCDISQSPTAGDTQPSGGDHQKAGTGDRNNSGKSHVRDTQPPVTAGLGHTATASHTPDVGSKEASHISAKETSEIGSKEASHIGTKETSEIGSKATSDMSSKETSDMSSKETSDISSKDTSDISSKETPSSGSKSNHVGGTKKKSVRSPREKSGSGREKQGVTSGSRTQGAVSTAGAYEVKRSRGAGIKQTAGDMSGSGDCRPARVTTGDLTPYEFLHAWTSLKTSDSDAEYLRLLLQVEPPDLPRVVSNKLDGGMLQRIIACARQLAERGEYLLAYSYLSHLTAVPRFDIVAMFMTRQDKQELRQVWDQLVTSIGDSDTETGLNSLQTAYGL